MMVGRSRERYGFGVHPQFLTNSASFCFEPPTVTWAYATHTAILEVDAELGRINIEKFVIVHDCGVVVNPMLVEG